MIANKKQKTAAVSSVALTLMLLLSSPAQAELVAAASIWDYQTNPQVVKYGPHTGSTVSAAVQSPAHMQAAASASYGAINVSTSGSISSGSVSGGAGAKFDDMLLLSNSALNGTQGQLTLAYYFDYDQFVEKSGTGFSNGSLTFLAWAGSNYSNYMDYLNTDSGGYTMYEYRDPNGGGRTYDVSRRNYLYVTTGFTWGQYLHTSFEINSNVGSYVPSNSTGTASFGFDAAQSGYWGGIVSASAGGNTVTDYDLTSRSGTDYSHSFVPHGDVPEPGTVPVIAVWPRPRGHAAPAQALS